MDYLWPEICVWVLTIHITSTILNVLCIDKLKYSDSDHSAKEKTLDDVIEPNDQQVLEYNEDQVHKPDNIRHYHEGLNPYGYYCCLPF